MINVTVKRTKKGWVATITINGGNPFCTKPTISKTAAEVAAVKKLKIIYL